jgi:hypothetical protein
VAPRAVGEDEIVFTTAFFQWVEIFEEAFFFLYSGDEPAEAFVVKVP